MRLDREGGKSLSFSLSGRPDVALCCCVTPIHHHRHSSSSLSTTLVLPLPLFLSLFSLHPHPHHDHSIWLWHPHPPPPPPLFLLIINNSSSSYSSFLLGSTSFFSSSSNHDKNLYEHFWQPFDLPMSAEPETLQKYFSSSSSSSPRIRHVWRNMNANSFSQTRAYTKETWCAKQGKRMAGWKLKKMLRVPHFWSSSLDSHSNLWLLSTWRRWTTYWWLWTFRGLSPCLAMHVFTKSLQRTKTGRKRLKSCTERW